MSALGAWGAFLSALGVAVTLWGTRTSRSPFARLRLFFVGPEPITGSAHIVLENATITATGTVTSNDKLHPGPGQDDRWHADLDRRIDDLSARLDAHNHSLTEVSLEKLRAEDERIRSHLDSKLTVLGCEAKNAERWNVAGLVLAFVGAVLQGLAVL